MMNLTEYKEIKHLHNTNSQNYTQKMWTMFYYRLVNNQNSILTP